LIRLRHLATPAVVLLLLALMALPAVAGAAEPGTSGHAEPGSPGTTETGGEGGAEEEGAGGLVGSTQRPQLLLVHGGSFLYEDPTFEPLTRQRAINAGFVPHYVTYPLDSIPAAVERVRLEAARLREKFGLDRVYAYGSSAGGTLVTLLAGNGLVSAAVAKAPITDLATWGWPTEKYGPEYWEKLGLDLAGRERLSPMLRPEREPLLVIQGQSDGVVPPEMNDAFAARFSRVKLWKVAGGHTTDRVRPFLVSRAMHWLAQIAKRNMGVNNRATPPVPPTP
jgi:pimeloyl-ACP methyl ester carboxylesterase